MKSLPHLTPMEDAIRGVDPRMVSWIYFPAISKTDDVAWSLEWNKVRCNQTTNRSPYWGIRIMNFLYKGVVPSTAQTKDYHFRNAMVSDSIISTKI